LGVEMSSGDKLYLDEINYLFSKFNEFTIDPKKVEYNLSDNRFIKGKISIFNPKLNNFSVVIYSEGELTDYLKLYSSFESFSEEDEGKFVRYDLDLPLNIKSGVYKEKIIVRYVPKGEFKGQVPFEEHEIVVNVKDSDDSIKLSPFRINFVLIFILLFILGGNAVFFLARSRNN
jgi:hypothetical protein